MHEKDLKEFDTILEKILADLQVTNPKRTFKKHPSRVCFLFNALNIRFQIRPDRELLRHYYGLAPESEDEVSDDEQGPTEFETDGLKKQDASRVAVSREEKSLKMKVMF